MGWQVPFLLSAVLVFVGIWVRRGVEESPVFVELAERKQRVANPVGDVLRRQWPLVILAALTFAGNNAAGYMTTGGFSQKYATDPKGSIGLSKTPVLWAVALAAVVWLIFDDGRRDPVRPDRSQADLLHRLGLPCAGNASAPVALLPVAPRAPTNTLAGGSTTSSGQGLGGSWSALGRPALTGQGVGHGVPQQPT